MNQTPPPGGFDPRDPDADPLAARLSRLRAAGAGASAPGPGPEAARRTARHRQFATTAAVTAAAVLVVVAVPFTAAFVQDPPPPPATPIPAPTAAPVLPTPDADPSVAPTAPTGDPTASTDPTDAAAPTAPGTPLPQPSAAGTDTPSTDAPSTDAPPTTLLEAPFSGYPDVQEDVVTWELLCPPDFDGVVPPGATTMGTAQNDLTDQGLTIRQVAVFASAEQAALAADELGRYARTCAGEYEPQPGFVASSSTVQPLDTGEQGLLVDTVAEDSVSATAILRRGSAVALVSASALPPYPGGRSAAEDVRAAATSMFGQLCPYEQNAC
ncbi:hypothetical protein [Jannaschia sp. R86511]|uniref:hypothetical protein n=1 Tax=Jannaschia sp. R86511 TaxID=3093853 RepID=UPI0036D22E68